MRLSKRDFGQMPDGRLVTCYVVTNDFGMQMSVINYGAALASLTFPEGKKKKPVELTLNLHDLKEFQGAHPYMGVTIGRHASPVAQGTFSLQEKDDKLTKNEKGIHHLHGSREGFDRKIWERETIEKVGSMGVRFTYLSRDGEEGYPGNLRAYASYELSEDNELIMTFEARTDKPTPVNLTNHAYWNLGGTKSKTIEKHRLNVFADHYLPVNENAGVGGEWAEVKNTPLDLREAPKLKKVLKKTGGLDHHYLLKERTDALKKAALLTDTVSKRSMEILTTEGSLRVYGGHFLDEVTTAEGRNFFKQGGICLGTQTIPLSVNEPALAPYLLHPGEHYFHQTVHRFSQSMKIPFLR